MKKFMTVAALLAAGTAFSNAAIETELLWCLDFTSANLELSSDSQSTATVSGNVGSIDTTGGLFGTGSYTTGTNKLTHSGLSLRVAAARNKFVYCI